MLERPLSSQISLLYRIMQKKHVLKEKIVSNILVAFTLFVSFLCSGYHDVVVRIGLDQPD